MLKARMAPVQGQRYDLGNLKLPASAMAQLERLARLQGRALSFLPEATLATLVAAGRPDIHLTLLRNSAHSNVTGLFGEEDRRLPDEDTLTVAGDFIGAYPNALYRIPVDRLPEFVDAVAGLRSEQDYARLAERYSVRRTAPAFWRHSDRLHRDRARAWPLEAAMFDYNRLENR